MKTYIFILMSNCCITHAYRPPYIPLLGAAKLGSGKITRKLLTCQKVNPNQSDEFGNTPLHYAVHIKSHEVSNLLLKHNAHTNAQNNKGKSPLHIAVQQDDDYLVRRLLIYGGDPNLVDNNGNTPLHLATKHNNRLFSYQIVDDLLAYGANPQLKNSCNQTPLTLANSIYTEPINVHATYKQRKNAQQIICLLKQNQHSCRPLTTLDKKFISTAKTTHVDNMKHLLHCPAININQQVGKHQRTALMCAAKNNRTKMVSYLLKEKHADKTLCDAQGKTAYDYAKKHKNDLLHALLQM